MTSEIVSAGNILDGSTGFLGLEYSSQNKHPLSGTNDLFTSRTIISSLLINNLKKLNDRRIYYFAEPLRIVSHAEQQLILAEAVLKGWISGDAKNYYESGVKSALADVMKVNKNYAQDMPIDQAYIDGYFTGEAAFKTTLQEQLQQIWMQRYILQFMQDAETSFFEYRRNGYPIFPINAATSLNENNKNGLPMRWLYPGSETTYNRENLIEALNRQYDGYDEINKIMWILK